MAGGAGAIVELAASARKMIARDELHAVISARK